MCAEHEPIADRVSYEKLLQILDKREVGRYTFEERQYMFDLVGELTILDKKIRDDEYK